MTTGIDALTEREKQTLRLILRGHDAKSAAHELALSVHTINERLREARRKLGVTSSREAARRLLEAEEGDPQKLGDKAFADAAGRPAPADMTPPATRRRAGRRLALATIGVLAMSLILAAFLVPASPVALLAPAPAVTNAAATRSEAVDAARAGEAFLRLVDESRWAESYAATAAELRRLNTFDVWSEVSARARPALG